MSRLAGTGVNYRKLYVPGKTEDQQPFEVELVMNLIEPVYVLDQAEGIRKTHQVVTHRVTMDLDGAIGFRDYLNKIVDVLNDLTKQANAQT